MKEAVLQVSTSPPPHSHHVGYPPGEKGTGSPYPSALLLFLFLGLTLRAGSTAATHYQVPVFNQVFWGAR